MFDSRVFLKALVPTWSSWGIKWGQLQLPLLLAAASFLLFFWNIDRPAQPCFDEVRYLPAARQILIGGVNENWSHPNLAKAVIGLGIRIFGDEPLGWRFMSVLFGVFTILGTYGLGLALFRNRTAALQGAALVLLNQLVFVHSRLATLDIFALGFMMPALALFAWDWVSPEETAGPRSRLRLLSAGLLFGLAIASKWIAVVPVASCAVLYIFRGRSFRLRRFVEVALGMVAVPALIYLFTLLPMLGMSHPAYAPPVAEGSSGQLASYGFLELLRLQWEMFQTQFNFFNPHPYFSHWYTWPLQIRPIWYHRDIWSDSLQSAVLLIGNPVVLWAGAAAAFHAVWRLFSRPSKTAAFLVGVYFPLFMVWGLVPRVASLFYYYVPASALLGPLLVFAAEELRLRPGVRAVFLFAAFVCFVYFYPILTNAPLGNDALGSRIWFQSWW